MSRTFVSALKRISLVVILLGVNCIAEAQSWKTIQAKADTLYAQHHYDQAIPLYSKAIRKSGLRERKDQPLLYKRAYCYYVTQQFSLALKDLDTFQPMYPDSPQPWILKAFVYREMDNDSAQMSCLSEAIRRSSDAAPLHKWRSMLYLRGEEYEKSLTDAVFARDVEDDAEVETYIALSLYNLNQRDSAFQCFNKAISLDPNEINTYIYAGSAALQDENYSLAVEYIDLGLKIDAHHKELMFYKGVALAQSDRLEEGCKCLNRAFYAGVDEAGDYLTEFCFGGNDE